MKKSTPIRDAECLGVPEAVGDPARYHGAVARAMITSGIGDYEPDPLRDTDSGGLRVVLTHDGNTLTDTANIQYRYQRNSPGRRRGVDEAPSAFSAAVQAQLEVQPLTEVRV